MKTFGRSRSWNSSRTPEKRNNCARTRFASSQKEKKKSEFVSLSFDWMTRTREEQRDGQKPEMKLGLKIVGDDALEPIN